MDYVIAEANLCAYAAHEVSHVEVHEDVDHLHDHLIDLVPSRDDVPRLAVRRHEGQEHDAVEGIPVDLAEAVHYNLILHPVQEEGHLLDAIEGAVALGWGVVPGARQYAEAYDGDPASHGLPQVAGEVHGHAAACSAAQAEHYHDDGAVDAADGVVLEHVGEALDDAQLVVVQVVDGLGQAPPPTCATRQGGYGHGAGEPRVVLLELYALVLEVLLELGLDEVEHGLSGGKLYALGYDAQAVLWYSFSLHLLKDPVVGVVQALDVRVRDIHGQHAEPGGAAAEKIHGLLVLDEVLHHVGACAS